MRETKHCDRHSRRRVLAGLDVGLSGLVAGCSSTAGDGMPAEQSFERLDVTPADVDECVDLTGPSAVSTVENTHTVELLVSPDDTAAEAERGPDRLADGKISHSWVGNRKRTESTGRGPGGVSDAEPDPQLVVAAAVGPSLLTFRRTWGGDPSDSGVLAALHDGPVDSHDRRESPQ